MNRYVAVALLSGFLYTASSTPEASAESFLIRYHSLVTDVARGLRQDVEVLIFNDGLVIEKSVTNDSSSGIAAGRDEVLDRAVGLFR